MDYRLRNSVCPICRKPNCEVETVCGHTFHDRCLKTIFSLSGEEKCPCCLTFIPSNVRPVIGSPNMLPGHLNSPTYFPFNGMQNALSQMLGQPLTPTYSPFHGTSHSPQTTVTAFRPIQPFSSIPSTASHFTNQTDQMGDRARNSDDPAIDYFIELCKIGDLESIKNAVKQRIDINAENDMAFRMAAAYGHLEVLRFLHSSSLRTNVNADNDFAFRMAAANGHLEVLKFLQGCSLRINVNADNDFAFRMAAANGHLEVMKYLRSCSMRLNVNADNDFAFRMAAANGHLEILKFLQGCSMRINVNADNDFAFRMAAANGHLEVMKYLRSCSMRINIHADNDYALRMAQARGHHEVARYLRGF